MLRFGDGKAVVGGCMIPQPLVILALSRCPGFSVIRSLAPGCLASLSKRRSFFDFFYT
jgi:hypothetical protein